MTETQTQLDGETGETVLLNWDLINRACSERGAHSAAERAELIGTSRAALYRWLAGADPGIRHAMRIADRLGVPLTDIVADPDGPRPPAGPQTPPPPPGPKGADR